MLAAHDYESKAKPCCDWSDPESRSGLVNGLVADGRAVIEACESLDLDQEQSDALGLLGVVTGQDVEADPERPGRWRIARRVAKDRTISTVDPESRHGRKTRHKKRDGYKAHIAVEPETGLITETDLTPANVVDADPAPGLVSQEPPGCEVVADSAYSSGPLLKTFNDQNHSTIVKPIAREPRIKGGYHRDDFTIDTRGRTVTCPAGHTARIRPGNRASFAKRCRGCPLRARCTTAKAGRTITVDEYHNHRAANKLRWTQDETQHIYRNYRPPVERTIAWLTRGKARRVPTEASNATGNGSPPAPPPSTYNDSSTSDSPTPPEAGHSTPHKPHQPAQNTLPTRRNRREPAQNQPTDPKPRLTPPNHINSTRHTPIAQQAPRSLLI